MRVGRVVRSTDPVLNGLIVVERILENPGDPDYHGDESLSRLTIVRGEYTRDNINLYTSKMDWFDNEVKDVDEGRLLYGKV